MNRKLIIAASYIFLTTTIFAQAKPTNNSNSCDELIKENVALKKSLNINESIALLSDNDIEFKIIKVKGDLKTQMVTI